MSKTKWYQKPVYLLVALALVLSLGIVALPMAGTVEANPDPATLHVSKWTEYAGNPIFGQGLDSGPKAYYPTVVKLSDTDYRMWYGSDSGIGYATSPDGLTWTQVSNPVSGLTNANHPLVEYIDGKFRIWYWDTGVSIYGISALRYAESPDGVNWTDDVPLTQDGIWELITGAGTGWNRGSYGPGDVIYNPSGSGTLDDSNIWNNKYVIYYMATNGSNEYIGLAYSADGKHWKRYGSGPVLSPCTEADDPSVGWDYRSVGYPTVMKDADGIWHMWFCGGPNANHGIGYAWSIDGISWTKVSNPIFHKDDGLTWRADRTYTPMVIHDGSTYKMWFSGKDTPSNYAIGYATADGPYPTIQSAIDAATSGDTIIVHDGIYTENIVINKSLTIQAASRPIIDGNNVGNTVTITASDVKLSGFRVTGGWQVGGHDVFYPDGGVVVDGNGGASALTGITIEDNVIDGNSGNGVYVSAAGHGGTANNVVIKDCEIFNNGGSMNYAGISLTHPNYVVRPVGVWDEWRRPKNILVQGNTIRSNDNYGLYVSAGEDVVIQSNIVRENSKYGIQLASSWNRTDIPCEYTTVENNDIYGNVRNGVKLTSYNQHNTFTGNTIYNNGLGGTSDRYKYGFLFQDGNDNTIQNNTITGNALGGLYLWGKGDPSYTWYSTTNNTITGNTISNHTGAGGHGIYIPAPYGNPNSGFLNSNINWNNITNNSTYGLENADTTQIVDAINNWWGHGSGPSGEDGRVNKKGKVIGKGDAVSDNVDWDPWLPQPINLTPHVPVPPGLL